MLAETPEASAETENAYFGDFLLSSGMGFGKPQRAQRTQREKATLCVLRVLCG
jgi:hypothetical protein